MKSLLKLILIVISIVIALNWQIAFAVVKGDHYLGKFELKEVYFDNGKEIYAISLWDVSSDD